MCICIYIYIYGLYRERERVLFVLTTFMTCLLRRRRRSCGAPRPLDWGRSEWALALSIRWGGYENYGRSTKKTH